MQTKAVFVRHMRYALNHLYDREALHKSPLIDVFQLSERFDSPGTLQRLLTEAIEALRPPPGEPLHSEKRKVYEILAFRYLQQFTQEEVAHHIGVSDRQFRREQANALEALSAYLAESHHLDQEPMPEPSARQQEQTGTWDWLKKDNTERVTNLDRFVQDILSLMSSVADQYHVRLSFTAPDRLPDLAVHPVALRQILLNLVQVAIHYSTGGRVTLTAAARPSFVDFRLETISSGVPVAPAKLEQENNLLRTADHMIRLCDGVFEMEEVSGGFAASLSLPTVDSLPVLVIDDSPEIIELLRRFTAGTRYHLTGITDPDFAIETAISTGARICILDVMMPRVDGWELLGRLRQHPQTAGIPVIILTILAQEELARALGARVLVLKPVTQERFLTALDEISAEQDLKSR